MSPAEQISIIYCCVKFIAKSVIKVICHAVYYCTKSFGQLRSFIDSISATQQIR